MIVLPWPPSINRYWRSVNGRNILSKAGRDYRKDGLKVLAAHSAGEKTRWPYAGRLSVTITVWPPDQRRRDIDNMPKAVLDLLTHGGVYGDDSQIDRLVIERKPVIRGGHVVVEVYPL